jgi:hypothetical protein
MDSDKFWPWQRQAARRDVECDDVTTSIVSLIRVALVYGSCNDGRPEKKDGLSEEPLEADV